MKCICGWMGERYDLEHTEGVEFMHNENRKNPECNMQHPENCYKTQFEKCPKCGRCLFSDGIYNGDKMGCKQ